MKEELAEMVGEFETSLSATDTAAGQDLPQAADTILLATAGEANKISGVVIGILTGFAASGAPLVDFPANPCGQPLPARATTLLRPPEIGRDVALMFAGGDPRSPLVLGLIQHPAAAQTGSATPAAQPETKQPVAAEAEVDGERLTFTARREIVFRCGQASITLTRAGKILLRGAYLLSRSSGVNRIKGGSVQIN